MIETKQALKYCCEDLSLIENYDLAVADQTQTWECHHRLGVELSKTELIRQGLYWNRPASELIFLTKTEHSSLHASNRKAELRYRMGKGNRGKHLSKEHRSKISSSNKGKSKSDDAKANMSKAKKGKYVGEKSPSAKAVYQIDKLTGNIIKRWGSMCDAARALGVCQNHISSCCKGYRKSTGGFKWCYSD